MRALAIGTSWNTASGAREERICSALSTSWGELQQREHTGTGQCVQYATEKVTELEKLAKFTTLCVRVVILLLLSLQCPVLAKVSFQGPTQLSVLQAIESWEADWE